MINSSTNINRTNNQLLQTFIDSAPYHVIIIIISAILCMCALFEYVQDLFHCLYLFVQIYFGLSYPCHILVPVPCQEKHVYLIPKLPLPHFSACPMEKHVDLIPSNYFTVFLLCSQEWFLLFWLVKLQAITVQAYFMINVAILIFPL